LNSTRRQKSVGGNFGEVHAFVADGEKHAVPNMRRWVSETVGESVVISKLGDMKRIFGNFIDKTMLVIDPAGPIARKCMFKRFRLPNSLKWISFCFLDEGINPT
jgi:hypothetical protein